MLLLNNCSLRYILCVFKNVFVLNMCGIVAFLGNDAAVHLYNGLEQLQNRGYDSAGISTIADDVITTSKCPSNENVTGLDLLKDALPKHNSSKCGIAHTRWATHGSKTTMNSHPHTSSDGKFTLVHNGIIENYLTLKHMLIGEGYSFASQTDTEVIANLMAFCFTLEKNKNIQNAIGDTISRLEGTWGLVILCTDTPNTLYCTKHGSPLLVSFNEEFAYIVSEQSGFCNYVNNYFILQDSDICILHRDPITHTVSIDTTKANYALITLKMKNTALTPHPYPHWTIKEIYDQVTSSASTISFGGRLHSDNQVKLGGLYEMRHSLINVEHLILLGCGTSYNAAMIGAKILKEIGDFYTVQVIDGAEFTQDDIPSKGKTCIIMLSQSGETKDLHRCIEISNRLSDVTLVGVVNVVNSLIAREVHGGCYLNAGREVAVASTKSFTSQVILLYMMAVWFAQEKNTNPMQRQRIVNDLRNLSRDIEKTIAMSMEPNMDDIVALFEKEPSCFILGKGKGEAIAREGALKMKEMSYIHAEGYSTSSLKHGPFALLKANFPVILIAPDDIHSTKNDNAYEEIKSRYANIVVITDKRSEKNRELPHVINIPHNETFQQLLCIIPIQILAYKLTLKRELNPDMPRNLAKVVTVE